MLVRQTEGEVRGFLRLSTLSGATVADGDSTQVTHGDEVTNRLTFHFKDGSFQEETAVFTQRGHFHLLSNHLVQRGRVFKRPMDVSIDGSTGVVTVRYQDEKGNNKVEAARLALPPDCPTASFRSCSRTYPHTRNSPRYLWWWLLQNRC